jgi:tRNA(Ile)-lysidine synthase
MKKDIQAIAASLKKGIEETARLERYIFLEEMRIKYSAQYILTAHHLGDSIETLLFNLIRGTKIHGLMGIPEQNGYILRPLLHLSKPEILNSLEIEYTPYRLDSSNTEDIYLRNHLRLNIVPEFERINPEYRKNMASFMGYMRELNDFIDGQVEDFL